MTRVINGDSRHDSKYHLQAEGGEGEEMRVVVVFHRCIVFLRSTVHEFSWIYHWANRFYEWRPTYDTRGVHIKYHPLVIARLEQEEHSRPPSMKNEG